MIRALYDWTMRLASHKRATPAMFAVSFAESSVFPIPPDVMLVPMVLARRDKAWWLATVCTVASVLGGLLGYAIGFFLFESLGQWLIGLYGHGDEVARAQEWFQHYGGWIVAAKGLTPFPFKVITITSGVAHLDIATFLIASVISRAPRFFIVAALLRAYGDPIRAFIEKRLTLVTMAFLALLVGGFLLIELVL
jgi:membrane protein YqaA with SNARE-associated domain